MSPKLEQIRRAAERVTRGFSQQQWHGAPEGKWSCAQILEHLRLTYTATTAGIQKGMAAGKPLASKPTLKERVLIFALTRIGYLPRGRTSPKNVRPAPGAALDSLRYFNDALVAMDSTLTDAEKRFGNRVKLLDHPFIGPLNAEEWRSFHNLHTKNHLHQMSQRAKEAAGLIPIEPRITERTSNTTATRIAR